VRGGNDFGATAYRGDDRRSRHQPAARTVHRSHVLALVATILAGGALLPLGLAAMPMVQALHAQGALRATWSLLFLTGGVLHLVRWRVTGESRAGLRGAGTVALGALTAPTTAIAPMLSGTAATSALSPVSRTVAVVACLALLTRAVGSPEIDTKARPLRALVTTLVASWAFIAAMIVLSEKHDAIDAGSHGWFAVELAMASGWLLVAVAAARQATRARSASLTWMTTACVLMGCAEATRAVAFVANPGWQFAGTGLQLVAAGLVLVNAATDLTVLISAESRLVHTLSGAVRDTEQQLSADERIESARRHDARAVLAALRTSSLVLDRYDASLDAATRAELLASFGAELSRLEDMIDRRSETQLEAFPVDSVVGPAVRSAAPDALVDELPSFRVYGRAMELRGLVENVLSTLGREAPVSQVRLRVTRSTSGVQIVCESTAATTASDSHAGDDVSARNLRLQVARRMMREQGGDVVVTEGWDGKVTVALWLRQAPDAPPSATAASTTPEPDAASRRLKSLPLGRAS